ncbi:MAG: aspartate/glutamate racemase family protein [Anaerolineae bacterium]|nr:aspartate/glutamate racemase family protein [Anaerolineae bacterium]
MPKLAIIHTTPATVDILKPLVNEVLPDYQIVNFVDDSILPQLAANGGKVADVEPRLLQYARYAEQVGANVILSACSSVGEVAAQMREQVSIPVVRIDDAMAEAAVRRGSRIGVAATLATTLRPTLDLLEQKAAAIGKSVELEPCLIDSAYQKLMAGDRQGHDQALIDALTQLSTRVDVIVLAQASMARVIPSLQAEIQEKVLTSPRLSIERVKAVMSAE